MSNKVTYNSDLHCVMKNEDVKLSPLKENYRAVLYVAASDPNIWEQHPVRDRWKKDVYDLFFDTALDCNLAFVVHDTITGACIGSSRYRFHNTEDYAIEIGWTFLVVSHWGGKYNRAIKQLMIE